MQETEQLYENPQKILEKILSERIHEINKDMQYLDGKTASIEKKC